MTKIAILFPYRSLGLRKLAINKLVSRSMEKEQRFPFPLMKIGLSTLASRFY